MNFCTVNSEIMELHIGFHTINTKYIFMHLPTTNKKLKKKSGIELKLEKHVALHL